MDEKPVEKGEYVIGIAIIIAALLVSATVYIAAGNLQQEIEKKFSSVQAAGQQQAVAANQQQAAAPPQQQQAAAGSVEAKLALTKEVTIDFLYADWCSHCAAMKPIVEKLVADMPADRFVVRKWRDEDRETDLSVAEVFSYYAQKGDFSGFPTFIINGEVAQAGEMPEAAFRTWVCTQFESPKPSACSS